MVEPPGTARPAGDGYFVSGRWSFASGCLHADWAVCGVDVLDDAGTPIGRDLVVMPVAELGIEDTWHVTGMRGTGSDTLVAEDVLVAPELLALSGQVLGDPAGDEPVPSDAWPVSAVLALILLGPMLGTTRAALDAVVARAPTRGVSYTTFARQTDSALVLVGVARASLDLDTAWLHALRAAADVDAAAGAGVPLGPVAHARLRGTCGYVTEVLRRAMATRVDIGGASTFADANPLQRQWRDLEVASRHAFVATNPMLEIYGQAVFGLEQISGLI